MSIERNGRLYADSTLLGDNGDDFFNKTPQERSLDLAWSEGCPVGPDLVKPPEEGGRGALVMEKRYGQVIFWFKYLTEELIKSGLNDLAKTLTTPRLRLANEPLGVHSDNWLPNEMQTHAYRSATGYILPRLLTEFLTIAGPDPQKNLQVALTEFDRTLPKATDDISLVVAYAERLARQLSKEGNNEAVGLVLKRLLGTAKLHEDNLYTEYNLILTKTKKTRCLGSFLASLDPQKLDEMKIYLSSPSR